jgi:dienelactone hydrolase
MHDRLKAAEVDVTLITFEGAGHGFKGADQEKANAATLEFFDNHLKAAAAGIAPAATPAPASPNTTLKVRG